jgi:DNA-binding response OmpR family regulator
MAGDEVRFLDMGMNAYLAKPVRASALEKAIMKQLF